MAVCVDAAGSNYLTVGKAYDVWGLYGDWSDRLIVRGDKHLLKRPLKSQFVEEDGAVVAVDEIPSV
jgi:hypothetical protein